MQAAHSEIVALQMLHQVTFIEAARRYYAQKVERVKVADQAAKAFAYLESSISRSMESFHAFAETMTLESPPSPPTSEGPSDLALRQELQPPQTMQTSEEMLRTSEQVEVMDLELTYPPPQKSNIEYIIIDD